MTRNYSLVNRTFEMCEIATPQPQGDQVLLRVRARSMDAHIYQGNRGSASVILDHELAGEVQSSALGGASANVLARTSRLECSTTFIGKVGKDTFDCFFKAKLEEAELDGTGLVMDPRYLTSLAFVTLDGKGDRDFSFYRNATADVMQEEGDVNWDLISASCIFHFGSAAMTDEPGRTAKLSELKTAKALCSCGTHMKKCS